MGDSSHHIYCLSVIFIGMFGALYFLDLRTRALVDPGPYYQQHPSSWHTISKIPPAILNGSMIPDWRPPASNWTLYLVPQAGMGNVLQAVASVLTVAKREGFDVKIVFGKRAFGSLSWGDLFLKPELGEINTTMPYALKSRNNCGVRLDHEWETVVKKPMVQAGGRNVKCAITGLWREKPFPQSALWFYRSLVPSQKIQQRIQQLQKDWRWHEFQWVGVHVRRSDNLKDVGHKVEVNKKPVNPENMFPIEDYVSLMKLAGKGRPEWPTVTSDVLLRTAKPIRYFLSTDNKDMRDIVIGAFPVGTVVEFQKDHIQKLRTSSEGLESAVIDLFLLASCELLIGTPASSFSATANRIGGQFFWEPRFNQ